MTIFHNLSGRILFLGMVMGCVFISISYQVSVAQIIHEKNTEKRLNIDAKAITTKTHDKEALARGREFQEIDSTYFMGYMFEGIYKVRHAQDLIGYKIAAEPLEKAYQLILKDYRKSITKRSKDVFDIYYNYQIQMYFQELTYNLWDAYMNAQEFQKAFDLTQEVAQLNIQSELYFQSYTHIAWIIHKLRIFTSKDFPFLKDDVYANVHLAMSYLDSAYQKAERDQEYNADYLSDFFTENVYSIAHYQAILHTYLFQMDSATFYYDLLKERGSYSHGNRGNYLYVSGKFRQAFEEYKNADGVVVDPMSKELKESVYYTSFIEINKKADPEYYQNLVQVLKASNSKPGFGWYNLAMARTLMYSGHIEDAQTYIKKAQNFKELHIGTTLGNEHYQIALHTIKYLNAHLSLKAYKKRHESWYWNPKRWIDVALLSFENYISRFTVVSLIAENPEREQVLYAIFASESVLFWNEIVELLSDINPQYFIKFYTEQLEKNTQRPAIIPYQKLMLAQLYVQQNEFESAELLLNEILSDVQIDEEYEQFLISKAMGLMSKVALEMGDFDKSQEMYYYMYRSYPSLAMTNPGTLKIYIQNEDSLPDEIVAAIEESDVILDQKMSDHTAVLSIQYEYKNNQHHATSMVTDADANIIVSQVHLKADSLEQLSEEIYQSLFGYSPAHLMDNSPD